MCRRKKSIAEKELSLIDHYNLCYLREFRCLKSKGQMSPHTGSIIGKGGAKIKEIQDASGARLNASEGMLPGSTEVGSVI